jgi:FtsZ-interacting cell division protein ZipA
MLTRVLLIIAIIAGIAAVVLGFVQVKEKVDALHANRDEWKGKFEDTDRTAKKLDKDLKAKTDDLKKEQEEHDKSKNDLASAQSAKTEAERRLQATTTDLEKARGDRQKALQDLNQWTSLGITPDRVKATIEDLKIAEIKAMEQVAVITALKRKTNSLQTQLDELLKPDADGKVPLPPGLRGKIVSVDPKWDFVILDIGEKEQARTGGEMLVQRDGKLIAKLRIRTVQSDRTIANVISGWKITDVREGDVVMH